MDFVLASNSRIDGISDDQIEQVCDTNIFSLYALDVYISGMLTNIFHLTDNIDENTRQYQNKFMEFKRYIQLSITPKSRIIEDHSYEKKSFFYGIRYLEEIFRERNHQY